MNDLAAKDCVPCKSDVPPLGIADVLPLLDQLGEGWEVVDNHHLARMYSFKNFADALAFVNRVGEMAETQGHHPDLSLAWGKVGVEIWTHKIDGLHESDFIFAAKCNQLYPAR